MIKNLIRIVLGAFMLLAGIGHLTYARETFQAQVPDWIPLSKDFVVVASGIVEIALGLAMIFFNKTKAQSRNDPGDILCFGFPRKHCTIYGTSRWVWFRY